MEIDELHRFFNLGDSNKNLIGIGEKGLGTKTYYKSEAIIVKTQNSNGNAYKAVMCKPWQKLIKGDIPQYSIEKIESVDGKNGTTVTIVGYLVDNPEKYFNYETIKDFIL